MSRSAFIASRQRVETISSDKTIASAETGELYFIDGSDDVVITLPAVQSGAYFKFMISRWNIFTVFFKINSSCSPSLC